ncbi:MAG: hypothetical protein IJ124_07795 [Clostridia bacterium]|nr:hypothetical protein [Clostridia bacterium]
MDKFTLAALLDEDRDMVLANIASDRALASAQAVLEKAIDRVMYRYVERCEDAAQRDSAQHILQAMKNTLPLMDAVGETRAWKKEYEAEGRKGLRMDVLTLVLLIAGALLVLASVIGMLIGGQTGGALAFLKVLLPTLLGGGCLFLSGLRASKPGKSKPDARVDMVRTEYLVDAEKAWHCLRGAMLQADGQLERIRQENVAHVQREAELAPVGGVPAAELELFAELLETAYSDQSDSGLESASAIRFFLHNAGIDIVDYAEGRDGWFEFLPAQHPGTIRPALVSEGKLLRKGLASSTR